MKSKELANGIFDYCISAVVISVIVISERCTGIYSVLREFGYNSAHLVESIGQFKLAPMVMTYLINPIDT